MLCTARKRKSRSTHAQRMREAMFQWHVCEAKERRSVLLVGHCEAVSGV